MLPRLRHVPKLHEESWPIDTQDVIVRTNRHGMGLSTVQIRLNYPLCLLLGFTILRLYEQLFYPIHNMSVSEGESTPGKASDGHITFISIYII